MYVKNLVGTGTRTCKCSSWTEHWENYSGARFWPQRCAVEGCTNPPEVGAHVKHVGTGDHRHYIVMMCRFHNALHGQGLMLEQYVKLARANVRETCRADTVW